MTLKPLLWYGNFIGTFAVQILAKLREKIVFVHFCITDKDGQTDRHSKNIFSFHFLICFCQLIDFYLMLKPSTFFIESLHYFSLKNGQEAKK